MPIDGREPTLATSGRSTSAAGHRDAQEASAHAAPAQTTAVDDACFTDGCAACADGRRKRHYRRNGRAVNYRALVAAADRALARATA